MDKARCAGSLTYGIELHGTHLSCVTEPCPVLFGSVPSVQFYSTSPFRCAPLVLVSISVCTNRSIFQPSLVTLIVSSIYVCATLSNVRFEIRHYMLGGEAAALYSVMSVLNKIFSYGVQFV